MKEYGKRKDVRGERVRLAVRGGFVVGLLLLTLLLGRATWDMYHKMVDAADSQEEAQAQLGRLEAQQRGVGSTLRDLTSTRGQEAQIRERFNVALPGEGEIDIIRPKEATTSSKESAPGWWGRVLQVLTVW